MYNEKSYNGNYYINDWNKLCYCTKGRLTK